MLRQLPLYVVHSSQCHAIPLAQFRWPFRTVQHEHGLPYGRDDVNVSGAVIVSVDHHPQAIEAKDGWHSETIS